jgi:hypothetical protein
LMFVVHAFAVRRFSSTASWPSDALRRAAGAASE